MAYEQRQNSGVLFRNDRKPEGSKQPDYKGDLNVEGVRYEMAAWIREGKTGSKFLSLSIKKKGD